MPANFSSLPPELRELILGFLAQEYAVKSNLACQSGQPCSFSLAPYTTVCREWKYVLERTTFSSLDLELDRMDAFTAYVIGERRRRVRYILLDVLLDSYDFPPTTKEETWPEKLSNNKRLSRTLSRFFDIMHDWGENEVVPGGISLEMAVSSPSDFRNLPFSIWERRRWDRSDVGDRRFQKSAVDFPGQDDEGRKIGLLKPVYAISSFTSEPVGCRTIVPGAYGEIISALPRVRHVSLTLPKDVQLPLRRRYFSQFGHYMQLWPTTLESLVLLGQNNTGWRSLPHEVTSERDSGQELSTALRKLSPHLRHLSIRNLIKIRDLLGPLWPTCPEDRSIVPLHSPDMPIYKNLETVDFHYASLMYDSEWFKYTRDFNDQEATRQWRYNIAFAAARLAMYMPNLRRMTISQRPMMLAGKHNLYYEAFKESAEVVFESSFEFKPPEWVVSAWVAVGKKSGRTVQVRTERLPAVQSDGIIPQSPPTFS